MGRLEGVVQWRNAGGRLFGSVAGVDRVLVERDSGYWFWTTVQPSHGWETGYANAAEAQADAEAWFLSRLAAAGE